MTAKTEVGRFERELEPGKDYTIYAVRARKPKDSVTVGSYIYGTFFRFEIVTDIVYLNPKIMYKYADRDYSKRNDYTKLKIPLSDNDIEMILNMLLPPKKLKIISTLPGMNRKFFREQIILDLL